MNHQYGQRTITGPWQLTSWTAAPPTAAPAEADWIPASVPGVVQYDLVAAGKLENPFGGTVAALAAAWVARSEWLYRTSFDVADLAAAASWRLSFEGVDTFADVWLNGARIGSTSNAYRVHAFDVDAAALRPQGNELLVHVHPHETGVDALIPDARRRLGLEDEELEGRLGKSLIRRYQRSFFTGSSLLNVGTSVLGIGIHRPVTLTGLSPVRLTDLYISTDALDAESARLTAHIEAERQNGAGESHVELVLCDPDDSTTIVARGEVMVGAGTGVAMARIDLRVAAPRLWWPRGYGDQTLYVVRATVCAEGEVLDTVEQSFGIRTVELIEKKPNGRPAFEFVVNGVPMYVRGTNYIPVDYLKVHGDKRAYDRAFALLGVENVNLVRMWGGGAGEADGFFDRCDHAGILVWQDFYLHSNVYPDYDEEWVAEFARESRDLVRQMRRHASLGLLCGGNEQREGWDEYGWRDTMDRFYGERLITETIPGVIADLPTGVPYVDNSPHGGTWSQSPIHGEGHIWGNFFNSTKDPLFVTETCWGQESYSKPETLSEVMGIDVADFTGPGWAKRWAERTRLGLFNRTPFTGYHSSGGLAEYIEVLELEQGMADFFSLSNFRMRSPSNRGIVYWSFNKGGPLFQFGAVDYSLRPLMSHFVISRLYRDVVVGAYRDQSTFRITLSNRGPRPVSGMLEVVHLRTEGEVIRRWEQRVELAADTADEALTLDGYYRSVVERDREVIFSRFLIDGVAVSDDLLMLCPLAELLAPDTAIAAEARAVGEGEWDVTVSTTGVSKLVRIVGPDELVLSDNYFPLVTDRPVTVRVRRLGGSAGEATRLELSPIEGRGSAAVALE